MVAVKAIVLSLVSAMAIAAPTAESGVNNPHYHWQVTGWSAGCDMVGCYYNFNVTGHKFGANPTIPAFKAYCFGEGVGAPFVPCGIIDNGKGNRGVAAKLLPAETGSGAHIAVSYQWTDLVQQDTYYNYTGNATATYNQFVAPLESFTITPSSAFAVA